MIDLHSHILPHMDDGSASPEETAALLDLLRQQGVITVVATPHFYAIQETPEAFLKRRQEAVAQMLPATENQPRILFGAEVAYFSGIGRCEEIIPLQIENTKLLLVEMPFEPWTESMVEEICQIPTHLGLTPVLAHVNRYTGADQFSAYKERLAESGVLFQCNCEAFAKLLSRRWALHMLQKGYIHFIGSDCHNLTTRAPQLDRARKAIEKKIGPNFLRQMDTVIEEILFSDN